MQAPNLLKYSNGWGHLIMSLALLVTGVLLLLLFPGVAAIQGLAVGLISSVAGIWLVTSSANSQAHASAAVAQADATAKEKQIATVNSQPGNSGIPG